MPKLIKRVIVAYGRKYTNNKKQTKAIHSTGVIQICT